MRPFEETTQSLSIDESIVREVEARLRAAYGVSRLGNKENPLDELIFIILTGATQEKTYFATFEALRRRFPNWDDAAQATQEEIADVIRFGGLAEKKARAISRLLKAIVASVGNANLSLLYQMSDAEAEQFLQRLPGVGPKTARCVLAYSLGRQAFAVDTHVSRLVRRLGWDKHHRLTDHVQNRIQALIPPDVRFSLHVNFVVHGRQICTEQRPRCIECLLADLCPSANTRSDVAGNVTAPEVSSYKFVSANAGK